MTKERVDILAVKQGLFESRMQAKRAIMAGEILGKNEERLDKPGEKIDDTITLHFKGKKQPYVGRGGFKLAKAIKLFKIDLKDKLALDIGSSTGGFTDVMLQNGAARVYALDVGSNQLVWKLRNDKRVVVMEHTNFRYSQKEDFAYGQPEFTSIDVSFISLKLILPNLKKIIADNGKVVALIKPQFEAGKDKVGKNGIVRDHSVHRQVLEDILEFTLKTGFDLLGLTFSPIKGGNGNIEFLMYLQATSNEKGKKLFNYSINDVLNEAYSNLN